MARTRQRQAEMVDRTESVRVLVSHFPSTVLVNLAVALVYAGLMWGQVPLWHLQAWLGLLLISIALRVMMTLKCRSRLNPDTAEAWARRFTLGALSAGIIWGIAGVMFPIHGAQEQAVYILGGLAAGAVAMNAAVLSVFFAFVIPMLMPLSLYFFIGIGGLEGIINGGLILFFTAVVSFAAWRYNQALRRALQLSTEQKRMSQELLMHRDHLRELVDARTAELNSAKLAAEEANRAKSDFLANITHELRTPVHAIMSFSAIGRDQADRTEPARIKEYFGHVRESGKRLVKLIDNLLDLAKMEAKCMNFDIKPHRLDALAEETVQELRALLQEKQLRLEQDSAGVDTLVYCDALRVGQVLRNLLSNAIRYSPQGGSIRIDYRTMSLPPEKQGVERDTTTALSVSISDQGAGIPGGELESIFDKFKQSSNTRSGAGGTGLGLAICREIVEAHGGGITACNLESGGAAFTFTLPRRPLLGGT